jgi:hypothetical protein
MKTYHLFPGDSVVPLTPIRHDRYRYTSVYNAIVSNNLFQLKTKFKKILIVCAGLVTGAMSGYVYWKYVGYDEHTPLISSVWVSVSFASSLAGLLLAVLSSPAQIEP